MIYRKIGSTDLEITAIACGTWGIGGWQWGGTDQKESVATLKEAIRLGITTIDTAPVYGFGVSEEFIGRAIKEIPRDKVQILSKCGLTWTGNGNLDVHYSHSNGQTRYPETIFRNAVKKSILKECEQSLARLGVDYIDLYQLHWPDNKNGHYDFLEAIRMLKEQGKIRAAGVSNFYMPEFAEICESGLIDSNQLPYSMINREIEGGLLNYCINNKKSVLAYSPLERGLLTGKFTPDYIFPDGDDRADSPVFQADNMEKINIMLNDLWPIAEKYNLSLAQLVLNWTVQQYGITCVINGMRTIEQVEENVQALENLISDDDLEIIDESYKMLNVNVY